MTESQVDAWGRTAGKGATQTAYSLAGMKRCAANTKKMIPQNIHVLAD